MSLFGSSKKHKTPSQVEANSSDVVIQKIPEIFYGGNNPVIYESSAVAHASASGSTVISPTITRHKSSTPSTQGISKRTIIVVSVLFFVCAIGASAYYLMQYYDARGPSMVVPSVTPPQIVAPPVIDDGTGESELVVVTSTEDVVLPSSLTSLFLEFPPFNTANTSDLDTDGLTDIEEELYGTDSGVWDTDGDGYYDGQEVVNLYNPRGFAPVRLIDSGLVREYTNPLSGYRVYYPIQWQRGAVDIEERHILFSAMGGEYVEVRVFEKTSTITFAEWFGTNAVGQQFNQLLSFTNRFSVQGWRRTDGLVAYFENQRFVFVVSYHQPDIRAPIPYRSTMEMIFQGFRPSETTVELPEQVPIVLEDPVATSGDEEESVE